MRCRAEIELGRNGLRLEVELRACVERECAGRHLPCSMDSVANNRMRKLARDRGFTEKPDPDNASQVNCLLGLDTPKAAVSTPQAGCGKRGGRRG